MHLARPPLLVKSSYYRYIYSEKCYTAFVLYRAKEKCLVAPFVEALLLGCHKPAQWHPEKLSGE